MVVFTHCCPNCARKRRMEIQKMGTEVRCVQCGQFAVAVDPDNESLAMLDSMRDHAQLTELSELSPEQIQRARAPR